MAGKEIRDPASNKLLMRDDTLLGEAVVTRVNDISSIADIHLHALAVDFASTLRHRQHLGRVGADQTCADLHPGANVVFGLHVKNL